MKIVLFLFSLVFAAVVGVGLIQGPLTKYKDAGCEIQGLGVCTISESKATCWDMAGNGSESLAAEVQSLLRDNHFLIAVEPGAKNRYLIARTFSHGSYVSFQTRGPGALSLGRSGDADWYFIHKTPPSTQSSVSITAWISTLRNPVILPFHEGGNVTVSGQEVVYGLVRKASSKETTRMPSGGPLWKITLGGNLDDSELHYPSFGAEDSRGQPIRFVDARGTPVSSDHLPRKSKGGAPRSELSSVPAEVQSHMGTSTMQGAFSLMTNIDPKWIKFLEIKITDRHPVVIGEFPLDPKP